MPVSFAAFTAYAAAYAPGVTVSEAVYNALEPDASAWVGAQLAGVASPNAAQEERSAYAYILYLHVVAAPNVNSITSVRDRELSVQRSDKVETHPVALLALARQHLLLAGLRRVGAFAGVAR